MCDTFDYASHLEAARFDVVRRVLKGVAEHGFTGQHHLYLTFQTDAKGVVLSDSLRAQHSEQMTIVLEHQFSDFEVDEKEFGVTLIFGGIPQRLTVPYKALILLADPSVGFLLPLQAPETQKPSSDQAEVRSSRVPEDGDAQRTTEGPPVGRVVSFDRSRTR